MKSKKCPICGELFTPRSMSQRVCKPQCAIELIQQCAIELIQRNKAKAAAKRAKIARSQEAAKKALLRERLKTVSDWKKEAQTVVNKYIRLRDKGKPCVSCGKPWQENFQAGHYYPAGRCSVLRFDERNIHGQCRQCNMHESGNLIAYRAGLIERIGLDGLNDLAAQANIEKRWHIEELKAIIQTYKVKNKELS